MGSGMDGKTFNGLLAKIKTDERAFRKIYEYYLPKIKYRILSKYGGQVDWEDVAHEFFVRLLKMPAPPFVESPTAWVYRSCENIAYDLVKNQNRFTELDERTASAPDLNSASDEESDFFSALNLLEGDDREIVKLVIWDGYNLKEASAMLGLTHAAGRQKYSRALKKLKKLTKRTP